MKIGYSNLLGEHVSAADIHHKDCEPFQIVCPQCREPTFKVERQDGERYVHYLSHYSASKAYAADCELRVSGLNLATLGDQDRVSRDQRLRHFLQVLRDLVGQNRIYSKGPESTQKLFNRSKAVSRLRTQHATAATSRNWPFEEFQGTVAGYLADLASNGAVLNTSFGVRIQERIAYDVWLTLLTPASRQNFEFLFNHGYIMLLTRLASAQTSRSLSQPEREMMGYMSRLPSTSKQAGLAMLEEMAGISVGPPFAVDGMTLLGKVMAEIMHEMIGTLIALPYFEVLRNEMLTSQGGSNGARN
jgi:hypothetical protein